MTALNESPLPRLGKRATGLRRNRTQFKIGKSTSTKKEHSISAVRTRQVINIEALEKVLDEMHKDVSHRVMANRRKQIVQHNKRTNIIKPSFDLGDFVLVRRGHNKGHKLAFRWLGPRRITRFIIDLVYEVTGLVDENDECVHATIMILYRASMDDQQISEKISKQSEHLEIRFDLV